MTPDNKGNPIPDEARKDGQHETATRETEIEKTGGYHTEHESPYPDADQHRSREHTTKPQNEEHDSM